MIKGPDWLAPVGAFFCDSIGGLGPLAASHD